MSEWRKNPLRRNKVEMELLRFKNQFKIVTPKRFRQCEECRDYYKNEQMYRRRGMDDDWSRDHFCTDCYTVMVNKLDEEIN